MNYVYLFGFFALGAIVGSFLNVCSYRIPRKESVAYPPSHCPTCDCQITALDNIPIISYVLLTGRCRSCGSRISAKYPIVEALTGILWAASFYRFGLNAQLIFALFFVSVLIVLSAIDYETKLIPDKILLPSMGISALLAALYLINVDGLPVVSRPGVVSTIGGFIAGGGSLLMIAMLAPLILKREAMGGGDIKLGAFMGMYLGGYVLMAIFIGSFIGALAGVLLMARKKASPGDMIPFGPFLAAGAVLTMFLGPQLLAAYLRIAGLG